MNEYLEAVGKASTCHAVKSHQPRPLRFVWHHILPRACGGQTAAENLIEVCDNCHYAIHYILFYLKTNNTLPSRVSKGQAAVALQGYEAAQQTGTVANIPKEASLGDA